MGLVRSDGNKLIALFDGDILVYRAGFAAEKRQYSVRGIVGTFPNAKSARDAAAAKGIPQTHVTWERIAEPKENAFHNVDKIINSTIKKLHDQLNTVEHTFVIFLTGCTEQPNFREENNHGYKANRDPKNKPTHYDEIRNYIRNKYPTVLTQGAETDDYLCQAAKDAPERLYPGDPNVVPVIVSIDKDLLSVPGLHYNFVKDEVVDVDVDMADFNFFSQMLQGDVADNVMGIKGYGPKKAESTLSPAYGDEFALCARAMSVYRSRISDEDWVARWNENAIMLYIWRSVPDICPWLFSDESDANAFIEEYYA